MLSWNDKNWNEVKTQRTIFVQIDRMRDKSQLYFDWSMNAHAILRIFQEIRAHTQTHTN